MKLSKVWTYLNGKKTNIAVAILIITTFSNQVIIGIWEFDPSWFDKLIQSFDWLGMALGGIGLIHKRIKDVRATNTE